MAEIKVKEELTGKVYASGKILASLVSEKGAKGDPGEKGESGTISIGEVKSGEIAEVTNSGTSTDAILNFVLPKGEKGEPGEPGEKGADGTGVNILGTYESEEILKENHPTGNIGDAYMIGGSLYVWSVNDNTWINVGSIKGEKGDKGDKGEPGEKGADGQKGADGEPGEKGEKGDKGDTGEKGEPGEQGIQGEKGEKGDESYPIGTIVEYEGDTIPDGFELVEDNSASVIVSSTEPTTGEEVWLQKGKNLFDKNNYNLWHGYVDENLNFVYNDLANLVSIPIKPNKTYTISKSTTIESFDVGTGDVLPISGKKANSYQTYTGQSSATITTGENDKFIYVYFYWGSNINAALEILETLQLEQGEVATTYEPYITKKIHTNTGNGYEEFYNEENREVYSTGEQRIGTYLGKPLYRKTYVGTTDVLLKHGVYVVKGLTYIDKLVSHKGFITFVDSEKTFVHEIGCYESDIHFSGIQLYKDGGDLRIFGGDGYAIGSTYDLTIEYTKTTD